MEGPDLLSDTVKCRTVPEGCVAKQPVFRPISGEVGKLLKALVPQFLPITNVTSSHAYQPHVNTNVTQTSNIRMDLLTLVFFSVGD